MIKSETVLFLRLGQVRPNTLEPALMRLKSSGEFSLEGYRAALGIPQLVSVSFLLTSWLAYFGVDHQ
jgi:hypothetical protein